MKKLKLPLILLAIAAMFSLGSCSLIQQGSTHGTAAGSAIRALISGEGPASHDHDR